MIGPASRLAVSVVALLVAAALTPPSVHAESAVPPDTGRPWCGRTFVPTSGTIPANWPTFLIDDDQTGGWSLERVRDGARHPASGSGLLTLLDRLRVGEMYRLVKAGCSPSGAYIATEAVADPTSLGTLTFVRTETVYGEFGDGTVWRESYRVLRFTPAPETLPFAEVMSWSLLVDAGVRFSLLPRDQERVVVSCDGPARVEARSTWPFFGSHLSTAPLELGACGDAVAVDREGNELSADDEARYLMRLEEQRDAGIVIDGGPAIAADAASFDAGTTTYGRDGSMWADGAFAEHGLGHNDCAAQPAAPRRAPLALFALLGWVIARRRSRR